MEFLLHFVEYVAALGQSVADHREQGLELRVHLFAQSIATHRALRRTSERLQTASSLWEHLRERYGNKRHRRSMSD